MKTCAEERASDRRSFSVLVLDMSHYQERRHETLVSGFPTLADAVEYARRRMRDSLEEQRRPGQTREALREGWSMFGEAASVVGGGYRGFDELEYFIEHAATFDERDWMSLERKFGGLLQHSVAE
ncbi:MAG: hypothetical protein WCD76_22390 [Pyrinomonadaceae bacterium]